MTVTSSWWSVLMLMSQQLAALILLALPAFISTPPPCSSSSFKAAAAAVCHTHFNTPDSFDRLYGLIILNVYRSYFPKPSMFIQHLRDHSTAPFSILLLPHPPNFHTFLFSLVSCFSPPLSLTPQFALLQPSLSACHWIKSRSIFVQFLLSFLLSGLPFLQWLGLGGLALRKARQRERNKYIRSV